MVIFIAIKMQFTFSDLKIAVLNMSIILFGVIEKQIYNFLYSITMDQCFLCQNFTNLHNCHHCHMKLTKHLCYLSRPSPQVQITIYL